VLLPADPPPLGALLPLLPSDEPLLLGASLSLLEDDALLGGSVCPS
jgi:hypothetical protein